MLATSKSLLDRGTGAGAGGKEWWWWILRVLDGGSGALVHPLPQQVVAVLGLLVAALFT